MDKDNNFDSVLFANEMKRLLGARYCSMLIKISGASRTSVKNWLNKERAPKKGPSLEYQQNISNFFMKEYNIRINWADFQPIEEFKDKSRSTLTYDLSSQNSDVELKKRDLIIEKLQKEINELRTKLQEAEYKNIEMEAILYKR